MDSRLQEVIDKKIKELDKVMFYIADMTWLLYPDCIVNGETISDCLKIIEDYTGIKYEY